MSTTTHPGCNGTSHQRGCLHLSGESDLDLVAVPPAVEPEKTRAFGDTQDPRLAEREGRVDLLKEELTNAAADLDHDDSWAKFLEGTAQMRSYSANNQMLIALQTGGRVTMCAGQASGRSWAATRRPASPPAIFRIPRRNVDGRA